MEATLSPDVKWKTCFYGILNLLDLVLDETERAKKLLITSIIMLTYCYFLTDSNSSKRIFPNFPVLYLKANLRFPFRIFSHLLHDLCHSPVYIPRHTPLQYFLKTWVLYNPGNTLILGNPSSYDKPLYKLAFLEPNDYWLEYFQSGYGYPLQTPRLIVSVEPRPLEMKSHSILLNIRGKKNPKEIHAAELKLLQKELLKLHEYGDKQIKERVESYACYHSYQQITFAIRILAAELKDSASIDDSDFTLLEHICDEADMLTYSDYDFNIKAEVLYYTSEFIDLEGTKYKDGYYPLFEIVKFFQNKSTDLYRVTTKFLSQILNEYNLVEDSVRRRIDDRLKGWQLPGEKDQLSDNKKRVVDFKDICRVAEPNGKEETANSGPKLNSKEVPGQRRHAKQATFIKINLPALLEQLKF